MTAGPFFPQITEKVPLIKKYPAVLKIYLSLNGYIIICNSATLEDILQS
jgi:hypothetical protein